MTSVNVPEWEWASQEHPPQFPARYLWRTAVASVAARAKQALPDAHKRIDQAVKLIHSGDVVLLPNGTAQVTSQGNPKTVYEVKGKGCTCPAALYRAEDGWCQHLFAALIMKRATTLVNQKLEANDRKSETFPKDTPKIEGARQRHEETPASCTLTFALSGVDMMLTMHGASEQALFPRIRHVLAWIKGLSTCMTEEKSAQNKPDDASEKSNPNDQVP